jgi:hypothetical protein
MNFDIGEVLSQEIAYSVYLCFQYPSAANDGFGAKDYNYAYESDRRACLLWCDAGLETPNFRNGNNLEETI